MNMRTPLLAGIAGISVFALATEPGTDTSAEWPAYGRDPGVQRFSPLAAIDRGNVASLRVAWTFRTGDAFQPEHSRPTAFEATPRLGSLRRLQTTKGDRPPHSSVAAWAYLSQVNTRLIGLRAG